MVYLNMFDYIWPFFSTMKLNYSSRNHFRSTKKKIKYVFLQNMKFFCSHRVDKKRDKLERKVLDSQERAFWDVHRPVVGLYSWYIHYRNLRRNGFYTINQDPPPPKKIENAFRLKSTMHQSSFMIRIEIVKNKLDYMISRVYNYNL